MKALVIHSKQNMQVEELPTPDPGPDQVRLRMAYVGICGSDLHYYFDGANGTFVVREPLIPGHEVSGTVDLDPSGELAPGTPVTVHPARFGQPEPGIESDDFKHLWAGGSYLGSASTMPHTQGGMSEYLIVERSMVRLLPEGLDLKTAALAEPLGVALHGINQIGGVQGAKVLVSGSGPIGLMAAAAALASGAAEVVATDVLPGPLERARALGVTRTVQVNQEELPANYFDVALECSGAPPAMSATMVAVRKAGRVAQLGMLPAGPASLVLAPFIQKEIMWVGCFRFNTEIDDAIDMLAANPGIAAAVTHVISADEYTNAFDTAKDSDISGKVLVDMWT